MKICLRLAVFLLLALVCLEGAAWSAGPPQAAKSPTLQAEPSTAPRAESPSVPQGYELSPQKRAQAEAYSRTQYALYFSGVALVLLIYFLVWRAKIALAFRNWARRISPRHFVQCLVFVPLFFLSVR
ncbi:MAG TPA: hypothetical protein VNG91_03840, partial [Terriglobia bacterium]|nr:hypothetical protein [Terriglobia bacterium]